MKKFILFCFACISYTSFAQTGNNSVLWKISGNGLKEPSYLFGTFHAVPEKQFVIGDSIRKCFEKSGTLILETNPDIPLGEQVKLVQRILLPKGQSCKDFMDSTIYIQFYSYLKDSLLIKEEKINKYMTLKPVFMQTMLLMEFIEKPRMFEKEFKDMAGKRMNFDPLETLDEQLSVIDSIPNNNQIPINPDEYKLDKEYYKLLDAYLNQDLKRLDSLMSSESGFDNIEYNLLTSRNLKWIPKIEASIINEPTFIAVGCGHLTGENGLIRLLEQDGYTLQPIHFSFINN
jgi:uncharacterized protein